MGLQVIFRHGGHGSWHIHPGELGTKVSEPPAPLRERADPRHNQHRSGNHAPSHSPRFGGRQRRWHHCRASVLHCLLAASVRPNTPGRQVNPSQGLAEDPEGSRYGQPHVGFSCSGGLATSFSGTI